MRQKPQVILIGGGEAFDRKADFYAFLKKRELDPYKKFKSWKGWLETKLSRKFEVFIPFMPASQNADYVAWKIWFEKYIPFLKSQKVILIGWSSGATFLLKYLSENSFPKPIFQLHLVAPAIKSEGLTGESMGNFKFSISKISKLEKLAKDIHLYHSKDDTVVPFTHGLEVANRLPKAHFHTFKSRGHFIKTTFPELLKNIKQK